MPTELLDLHLAFRALSDEDSDEGVDTTTEDDKVESDDEVEDDDMDGGDGDGDGADNDEKSIDE
jgi:hypothetical protein